ncbi:hypothetical protein GQ600_27067 [Phytophthora cactorum]|nr:hypothetical protein GQ600_27067 [Phytophthora cactorum]
MVPVGLGASAEERDAVDRAPTPTPHKPRDSRSSTRASPYSRAPTRRSPRFTPSPATTIRSHLSTRNSLGSAQSTPDAEGSRETAQSPISVIQTTPSTSSSATERGISHPSSTPSTEVSRPDNHRYQLVIRPIVKTTIAQRERSGEELDDAAFNGASFNAILEKIRERFSPHVKESTIKTDGVWSVEVPTVEKRSEVMQSKARRHFIVGNKSDIAWNRWPRSMLGETVTLLVCEYGLAITKGHDLETFTVDCIVPPDTDRAGATAESSLLQVVNQLRERWKKKRSKAKKLSGACGLITLHAT